jgi:hypothetical protein
VELVMTADGPEVIIGGAARSGTTSLYRWLDAHPEIAMAREKEVRFFDRHYDRGWGWYVEQLPDRQTAVVGEASPRYFTDPRAAERIAHDLPDVRMVFCLRDPVVRAYSDYWMDRQRGRGGATFESSLADEALHDRYVGTGHYARHLRRLQQSLPPAQVLTVTFDELTDAADHADQKGKKTRFTTSSKPSRPAPPPGAGVTDADQPHRPSPEVDR